MRRRIEGATNILVAPSIVGYSNCRIKASASTWERRNPIVKALQPNPDSQPRSEPALKLHSRAASSVGVMSPLQWSQHRKQFQRRADIKKIVGCRGVLQPEGLVVDSPGLVSLRLMLHLQLSYIENKEHLFSQFLTLIVLVAATFIMTRQTQY